MILLVVVGIGQDHSSSTTMTHDPGATAIRGNLRDVKAQKLRGRSRASNIQIQGNPGGKLNAVWIKPATWEMISLPARQ